MKVMPTFWANFPETITRDTVFLVFFVVVVVVSFLVQLKFQVRPQALEGIQNETNGPGNDVGDIYNLIGSQST